MMIQSISRILCVRTGKDYLLFVLAIRCGGTVTNSLVAPHPVRSPWTASKLSGGTERQTPQSWTLILSTTSITGLLLTLLGETILPFK